ncbi:MAG TPA: PIG-L deacetylase family protein [Pirellulaceae bacterium]|nr:PIG-L deacetylase family protein [Pirellulaceae bacterium]
MKLQLQDVRSILCLGAHPDDIEIGCGATVAQVARACPQAQFTYVLLSGSPERAREAEVAIRRLLPSTSQPRVILKSFRDSFFPYQGGEIKEFFHGLALEVAPDLIFTHRREDLHQDHRLLAELTYNAFRAQLVFEYEIPKYDGDLTTPNVYVPLSRQQAEMKIETIMESFGSQHDKRWFTQDTFWATLRIRGIECHSESGLAEGLYCRKAQIAIG